MGFLSEVGVRSEEERAHQEEARRKKIADRRRAADGPRPRRRFQTFYFTTPKWMPDTGSSWTYRDAQKEREPIDWAYERGLGDDADGYGYRCEGWGCDGMTCGH